MSSATKVIPLIVSRRSLQRNIPKYAKYLKEETKKSKPIPESSWPRSMQIAGYTAVALGIPYSISVVIAESPQAREFLEGDSNDPDEWGKKIVRFVRWYWGMEDKIPYGEFMELEEGENTEYSFESEIPTFARSEQAEIQNYIHSDVKLHVEADNDQERIGLVPGNVFTSDIRKIWKQLGQNDTSKEDTEQFEPKHIHLSFEDAEDSSQGRDMLALDNSDSNSNSYSNNSSDMALNLPANEEMEKATAVWSSWHHFAEEKPSSASSSTSSSLSSFSQDPYEMPLEKLNFELLRFQKDLNDPSCTLDRDYLQQRIYDLKREASTLRRERRLRKLKKWIPF